MLKVGGWSDLINGVEEIWVGEPFNLAWGSLLREVVGPIANSTRQRAARMVCSLPETLELGARGNAEKNGGPGPETLRNKAALPPDGYANPQKIQKQIKMAF